MPPIAGFVTFKIVTRTARRGAEHAWWLVIGESRTAPVEHVVQRGSLLLAEPAHHLLLDRGERGGVLLQERPTLVRQADQQPPAVRGILGAHDQLASFQR